MSTAPPKRPLAFHFRAAQATYNAVDSSQLGGADAELQKLVQEGLALCEAALVQVDEESIFSPNELAEDVNTCDLKYLLLGFYRGELLLRVVDQPRRAALLKEALASLRGFLADLERLGALSAEAKEGWELAASGVGASPGDVRSQKIARLKAGRAAKAKMALLAGKLKAAHEQRRDEGSSDEGDGEEEEDVDELEREQLLLLLQCCCHTALDSMRATEQEIDMLRQVEEIRRPDGSLPPPPTLEEEDPNIGLQMHDIKKVLSQLPQSALRTGNPNLDPSSRLSYATAMQQIHSGEIPGLYTYTVEEGFRIEEAQRAMEEAARMDEMSARAQARLDKKAAAEEDEAQGEEDADERRKLIKQDEFRDMNKRGSGNRKNRN